MRKNLYLPIASLLPVVAAWAAAPTSSPSEVLEHAELRLRAGDYAKAVSLFETLAKDGSLQVRSAIGIARAWIQVGRYEEALARLDAVQTVGSASADWHIARAEVLRELGRYADALGAAQRACEIDTRGTSPRRLLGELYEVIGEKDKAIETYAWFDSLLKRGYPARASALADSAVGIYRHAVLSRRADAVARTRYALHELLQPAYERVDTAYWPARMASADLLLGKYNLEQAAEDYRGALKINPHLADGHVGLGLIALNEWKFEETEQEISHALAINPRSVAAHRLRARLRLTERKFTDAVRSAEAALQVNPSDIEALALLAAAQTRAGDATAADRTIQRAKAVNERSPLVYYELGAWLSAGRQFVEAERQFKRAIELAPEWPSPRTTLGMMYMETGDESSARRVLDASWKLDPYHEATRNVLDLLDKLERFGRDETPHFVVRSQEGPDAAIRNYLAQHLESIYSEVCRDFGGEPSEKTLLQVFPDHAAFAVRVTGKPWIHTIGACTGRVIAMDAPRLMPGGQSWDWASVLRHEFTHVVTLAATRNRIPHWFTEGLAVRAEANPRTWKWCRMLSMALRRNQLFDLESIDWAFVRPRRAVDRILAYAQSEWMVEYLVERHGAEIIGRLLEAFRDSHKADEAFETATRVSSDAFIRAFRRWAKTQVTSWGLSTEPIASIGEIEKAMSGASPGEQQRLRIALAESRLDDGELDAADSTIRAALEPPNAEAISVLLEVLAAIPPTTSRPAPARKSEMVTWAGKLASLKPDDPTAVRILARHAMDEGDTEAAISGFMRLKSLQPRSRASYQNLAKLYKKLDRQADELDELLALARVDPSDGTPPARIAELLLAQNKPTEAIDWLRRAVHFDVYSETLHVQLAELLMREKRPGEAVREFEIAARLSPGKAAILSRLAIAYHDAGDAARARQTARRAVALDPDSAAKSLLSAP